MTQDPLNNSIAPDAIGKTSDPMPAYVCAVVISYKPPPELLDHVRLLLKQVHHVVVVDNTPCTKITGLLDELELLERCTVIRNGKNLGIATALNMGIAHAIDGGFSWIVTFDQDSQVPDGFMEEMLSSYREAAKVSHIGVLCPRYRDAKLRKFLQTFRGKNGEVVAGMTSGSMAHADTFRSLGRMEDALFIDYVDIEFCLRARSAGFSIIESSTAVLEHSLGQMTMHRLFGRQYTTTNHSAIRRYYITRNRLVLILHYFLREREWAIGDLKGIVVDAIKICLAEKDKLRKLGYMARATFDAILGRMGQRVKL